jgi:hypothetical protein
MLSSQGTHFAWIIIIISGSEALNDFRQCLYSYQDARHSVLLYDPRNLLPFSKVEADVWIRAWEMMMIALC